MAAGKVKTTSQCSTSATMLKHLVNTKFSYTLQFNIKIMFVIVDSSVTKGKKNEKKPKEGGKEKVI